MHTFTIVYVTAKDTLYFMATEHFSHAKFEIFDKIEHVTLFILWKFARVLDEPLSHENQVNFAILHTTNAFVSVVELRKSLKESKKNIFLRWNRIYLSGRGRRARGKAPINYSDDKQDDISNQPDTLPTPSNNAEDEDIDSESIEGDPNSEKDDTNVPGSVFHGKNFWTSLVMIRFVITLPSLDWFSSCASNLHRRHVESVISPITTHKITLTWYLSPLLSAELLPSISSLALVFSPI